MASYLIFSAITVILFSICNIVFIKGLAIFKFFVALYSGFMVGTISMFFSFLSESRNADMLPIFFIIGFIIGFIIAWPLYKFFIYVAAAFLGFAVGALLGLSMGATEGWWFYGLIFASGFIYIVHKFLNYYIIMSVTIPFIFLFYLLTQGIIFWFGDLSQDYFSSIANQAVVFSIDKMRFYFHDPGYQLQKVEFLEAFDKMFVGNHFIYIIQLISFLSLAFFYQLYCDIKKDDPEHIVKKKNGYKKVIQFVMLTSIIIYTLSLFQGLIGLGVPLPQYLTFFIVAWPLFLLAVYFCVDKVLKNPRIIHFMQKKKVNYWLTMVAISIILIPLVYILVTSPRYFRKINSYSSYTVKVTSYNDFKTTESVDSYSISDPGILTVPFLYAVSVYGNIFSYKSYNFYPPSRSLALSEQDKPFISVHNIKEKISIPAKIVQLLYYFLLIPIALSKIHQVFWPSRDIADNAPDINTFNPEMTEEPKKD